MSKLKLTTNNHKILEDTFNGKFYIMKQGNLYNLILVDSHFSMASNHTLEGLISCLKRIVERYKCYSNLTKALKNMEYPVKVPSATYEARVKYFKESGDTYTHLIEEVLNVHDNNLKEEIKEKNKVKPLKVKKKIIIKKAQ